MEAKDKAARRIGYEIANVSHLMRRKGPSTLPSTKELTPMQNWVIGYVRENEGTDVFQSDIERVFHVTGATATNVLKRMERDRLIAREPVPSDRRKKRIVLTERSIHISDEVRERIMSNEQLMKQGLTEKELAVFFSVIDKIKENLQK